MKNPLNQEELSVHVNDNTIKGKCSNCGECCTEFIPLTKTECKLIKQHLKQHPEIKNQQHIVDNNIHMLCPFRDREKQRCTIYSVRPFVCRRFICSTPHEELVMNKAFGLKRAHYNSLESSSYITLHTLFFNDIEWELKVLYNMVGATDEQDFKTKLIKLNPMILNQGIIIID